MFPEYDFDEVMEIAAQPDEEVKKDEAWAPDVLYSTFRDRGYVFVIDATDAEYWSRTFSLMVQRLDARRRADTISGVDVVMFNAGSAREPIADTGDRLKLNIKWIDVSPEGELVDQAGNRLKLTTCLE